MGQARNRKQQPRPAQPGEMFTIFKSAEGFRECARPFRQKMAGLSIAAASTEALKDLGGMVASATTLALSIELYLKGFRMLYMKPANKIHNLDELYADLPLDLSRSIEADYEATPKPPPAGVGIAIDISKGTNTSAGRPGTDHSLPTVLQRSSRVFEEWRYLYEEGEPGKVKPVYEYHYLGVAADVMHAHAAKFLRERIQVKRGGNPPRG